MLQRRYEAEKLETKYYTPEVHIASFALPKYIKDLFKGPEERGLTTG